ncbi:MAG: glycerol-3-phosphate dehydrogenase [Bacteroidota bacterium]|nr:glycerol-3-phosphate dehydrogenase [Bacteroidota bacterium]
MNTERQKVVFIGAGAIGTSLGNILAENPSLDVVLHTIEEDVARSINETTTNARYFPSVRLQPALRATMDDNELRDAKFIFLAIPSVIMVEYLKSKKDIIPGDAILINLAKGFGNGHRTIIQCLKEFFPNPLCTMKGPTFAREIIIRMPTGFTLGCEDEKTAEKVTGLFANTPIYIDHSTDIQGVELLSILKNMYAIVLGIVDAQYNSPNIRFMVLTRAFREMREVLLRFGGKEETLFCYCGYGDFTLTSLNDLSRNRTLGLLIGKGFFSKHVSKDLVLEGKTAVTIFYQEMAKKGIEMTGLPIISGLYELISGKSDVSTFLKKVLEA